MIRVPRALVVSCAMATLATVVSVAAPGMGAASAPSAGQPASARSTALVPDPGARGPYGTERIEVFRGWERVEVDMPLRVEDLAEVTLPMRNGEVAPGRHPVVLLLHGRHAWCSTVGGAVPDPVPAGAAIP